MVRISLPARRLCNHAVSSSFTFCWVSNSLISEVTSVSATSLAPACEAAAELLVVIALDALGIDIDAGTKTSVDQAHQIELQRNPFFQFVPGQPVTVQHSLPRGSAVGIRILFANLQRPLGDSSSVAG